MRVKIIDSPNLHLLKNVWMTSRPKDIDSELSDILGIDAPINDFAHCILEIESTLIEREIIASFRDHIMWAQTSRVNNILEFEVDPYFHKYKNAYDDIKKTMNYLKDNGNSQDDYRMMLPIVSMTTYTIKISIRTLIKIQKQFNILSKINKFFYTSVIAFSHPIIKFGLVDYVSKYKHYDINKPIKIIESGSIGDTITISTQIPIGLRAHIIRHRNLSVSDDISYTIKNHFPLAMLTDPINVQISATVDIWKSIYMKRSCWLSHYGIWHTVLNNVNEICNMDKEIPCSDGICPYKKDAELRYTGADPGIPCPMHATIYSINIDDIDKKNMRKRVINDNRPLFWNEVINEL